MGLEEELFASPSSTMPDFDPNERRQHRRFTSAFPVVMECAAWHQGIETIVLDLSVSGILLESDVELAIGTACKLSFPLPSIAPMNQLTLTAKVVRILPGALGLKFERGLRGETALLLDLWADAGRIVT